MFIYYNVAFLGECCLDLDIHTLWYWRIVVKNSLLDKADRRHNSDQLYVYLASAGLVYNYWKELLSHHGNNSLCLITQTVLPPRSWHCDSKCNPSRIVLSSWRTAPHVKYHNPLCLFFLVRLKSSLSEVSKSTLVFSLIVHIVYLSCSPILTS